MKVFAATIFIGAFLLFSVQPMMGKFILPWFGGGTAVWSACLLFFQVILLGGYTYAHCSARWLRPKTQIVAHFALIILALLCLPVIPNVRWQPGVTANPTLGILLLLTMTVGLPYLVLSTTGPLMQHWFSVVEPQASPYRLYAVSNAGSLLGLISYPFLVEPLLTRKTQALAWSFGLVLFAAFTLACAVILWRARSKPAITDSPSRIEISPTVGTKLLWLLLPACASALLLATTNKICLDITVMPFLWVLPLTVYLLSFVWSFAGRYVRRFHGVLLAIPLLLVLFTLDKPLRNLPLQISLLIFALYYCCLVCHGELYKLKPAPRLLTAFYLMIAAGGALGSAFVTIIAPLIFDDYFELHWAFAVVPLLMAVIHWRERGKIASGCRSILLWRITAVATAAFGLLLFNQVHSAKKSRLSAFRNFYGVLKISEFASGQPHQALALTCGTTLHGFQLAQAGLESVPTGYYHERSGVGLLMNFVLRDEPRRVGIVGVGTGTLAAYGRTGDVFRFYEINPMDIKLAGERFSFLSRSKAQTELIPGDARLSLERESPQQYDVLVLDAFNSDAVPVHLLTKEAFEIYARHLKPDAVIAVHISCKHLNLVPLLEAVAGEFHLEHALIEWRSEALRQLPGFQIAPWQSFDSQWFLLSRNSEFLKQDDIRGITTPQTDRKPVRVWTDDYTSLLPLLVW